MVCGWLKMSVLNDELNELRRCRLQGGSRIDSLILDDASQIDEKF
jgi:hypothetical protein